MGGLWEWTSSPLRRWPEFEPMSLYPLYTGECSMTWLVMHAATVLC